MPLASLLPLFVYFVAGIVLRMTGIVRGDQADILFRIVFHVTLPALAFLSVTQAALTRESLFLPIIGFACNLICLGAAYSYSRFSASAGQHAGSFLLGASITNMIFIFPFVLAVLGPLALADAILFDLGNAIFVATVANSVATHFGHRRRFRARDAALRLFRTPLFVALLAAIILNLSGQRLPMLVSDTLTPLGAATAPLTIVALGLLFQPRHLRAQLPLQIVLLRMPLGLLVGLTAVWIVGFEGTTAIVVMVSAAAPIGFTAVTLAAVAKLEAQHVAAAVSLSIVFGMFSTTALLWLGQALW